MPGHPDLEELAALIDGRCRTADAARIRWHLASCAECYEVFSETLHLQEELRKDEEPAWGLDPFPFETRRKVWPRWAAAAAAAAVVLGVGLGLWRNLVYPTDFSLDALTSSLVEQSQKPVYLARAGVIWNETKRGSGDGERIPGEKLAVQTGVAVLNLQVALASNNKEAADSAAAQVCSVLGISRAQNRPDGALQATQLDLQDDSKAVKFYGELRGRLEKAALLSLAREAAGNAEALRPALDENYFDLGKWTEAGRFAAIARKPAFFQKRRARYLLGQLQSEKDAEVPSEVVKALKAVDTYSKQKLSAQEYRNLQTELEKILDYYYPQGRPYDF